MTRFLLAAVLAATLGSAAGAQQPVPDAQPLPPVVIQLPLNPPPIGPAIPFHKSGGLVVGMYGLYPYDTGYWLLGDTQGVTRQSGAFTMVYPDVSAAPAGVRPGHFGKHGWLRR